MSETSLCQNCGTDFAIGGDDLIFYSQMKVPAPTMCPNCRLARRLAWRNERALWKTACGLCAKSILAAYPAERTFPVYCHECWWGDGWDAESFAMDVDFSRPFFEQIRELLERIPKVNLSSINSINSEYANGIVGARNAYLAYSIVESEDVLYSKNVDRSRQIIDCLCVSDSERLAHTTYSAGSYDMTHSQQVRSCMNGSFLFDCINSSYCFMSANLRNAKYVFRGEQCTKEEYERRLGEIAFESARVQEALLEEFEMVKMNAIHKYADILKSTDTTGDSLTNMKNCRVCFEAYGEEDSKWASRAFNNKNVWDVNNIYGSELVYEYITLGSNSSRVAFSMSLTGASTDVQYSGWSNGADLFGCFGMRNKKYCILNKQYSEAEYRELVPKIIEHMNAMPYEGANGRLYRYGEFFPIELSPFAYNESVAQEQFPLAEEEILERGYRYHAPEEKNHAVTLVLEDIPDSLRDVPPGITKETIACLHAGSSCVHQCTKAFRITADELAMYGRFRLPLPRMCPNCRHYKRLEHRKPWELWHRSCMCSADGHSHAGTCPNEFETAYAPGRPEVVYCESCYLAEVV